MIARFDVTQSGRVHHLGLGGLQFRCADCGARTCCLPGTSDQFCTGPGKAGFIHRYVPMGTGRPTLIHRVNQ